MFFHKSLYVSLLVLGSAYNLFASEDINLMRVKELERVLVLMNKARNSQEFKHSMNAMKTSLLPLNMVIL